MKVQELFKSVDRDELFFAFIRRHDIIQQDDHRRTIKQEVALYKKYRDAIDGIVDKISTCETEDSENIIFVVEVSACDYEDKKKGTFDIFSLDKDVFLSSKGRKQEANYCSFALVGAETVAGYEVSEQSIDKYGIEAVCSEIINEIQMTEFNITKEMKWNFMKEIKNVAMMEEEAKWERIKESIEDELYKEVNVNERKHHEALRRYQHTIQDLKDEWCNEKKRKNKKILNDFVRKEYDEVYCQ